MLLLDEPFGALDAKVRRELRRWLRRLHDEIHITSVFVTHDQEEALEVADRVVVMNDGRIEQIGTPEEVYDHPASPFVYDFLGNVNRFHARVESGRAYFGETEIGVPNLDLEDADEAVGFVRPHELEIVRELEGRTGMAARVIAANSAGPLARVELQLLASADQIEAVVPREQFDQLALRPGDSVFVIPRKMRVFRVGRRRRRRRSVATGRSHLAEKEEPPVASRRGVLPLVRSYASFFCFGSAPRISNGGIPSVMLSGVTTTSRTSGREGMSNITSHITSSITARRPRAPVPRSSALRAIARTAAGSKVSPTPSIPRIFRYCLMIAFFGSARIRTSASSSRLSSVTTTGRRPTSSGIRPKRSRSSGSTSWKGLPLVAGDRAAAADREADLLPPRARLDDLLETVERAAADEEDIPGVDLDVLLLRMLPAALRRNRRSGSLEDLQQGLLHALAGDVPRDRRVLALAGDLVDLVDVDDAALALGHIEVRGLQQPNEDVLHVLAHVARLGQRRRVDDRERDLQGAGERLRQERLAHARRADEHDVRLVELDVVAQPGCG